MQKLQYNTVDTPQSRLHMITGATDEQNQTNCYEQQQKHVQKQTYTAENGLDSVHSTDCATNYRTTAPTASKN